jgi:dihydrodipicolinate synthase/N-acetylneuraminate lyase
MDATDPLNLLRRGRRIRGASAVLLPFDARGGPDWEAFHAHLLRTAEAGLLPAVNMDTGHVQHIDAATRRTVLERTSIDLGGLPFLAGAFVGDRAGDRFARDAYLEEMAGIAERGATPVVFPSYGLTALAGEELVRAYGGLGQTAGRFVAFELGAMFAPCGRIYELETFRELMKIEACVAIKHSSLDRRLEWQRLALRDRVRPEFVVYTGNDLAIDMVMYGSDYLLGLSTFSPESFARRDAFWAARDPRFYELNDLLQYLGFLAFREPISAYKHSAAQFLKLGGLVASDAVPSGCPRRPESDLALLADVAARLENFR